MHLYTFVIINRVENEVFVLLGHNGAGKSTVISLLNGLYEPTSGTSIIYNYDLITELDEIRKIISVCPQENILYDELTVKEHLLFFGDIREVDRVDLEKQITVMMRDLGMVDKLEEKADSLSGGQKRKLMVALALIGNSKVIILDEPSRYFDI